MENRPISAARYSVAPYQVAQYSVPRYSVAGSSVAGSSVAGSSVAASSMAGLAAQPQAHLTLDTHPIGDQGYAGARVRHPVHNDETVEAHAHAAINPAWGAGGRVAGLQPLLGDEHGGDRLPSEGLRMAPVQEDFELGPAFEPSLLSEGETPAREWLHASSLTTSRMATGFAPTRPNGNHGMTVQ